MFGGRWFILLIALSVPLEHRLAAAEPRANPSSRSSSPQGASSLRFRRVYAPAERVPEWPRGSTRYIPIDGDEFERLITAAAVSSEDSPVATTLVGARYEAKYEGGDHLQGTLAWDVDHTAKLPTMMPVAPLGLALGEVRWREPMRRAEMGLSASGETALLVEGAGEVTASWSLCGKRDTDGQLSFRFDTPACPISTLSLTVPQGIVPVASAGLVSLAQEQGAHQVYRILLGAQTNVTLRLTGEAPQTVSQSVAAMREVSVYDFSTHGLDLATVWKLDVRTAPLRQVHLSLDAGLQLVSARLGEVDVPFKVTQDAGDGTTKVTLELTEPLTGSDRPLRLAAIGPLVLDTTRPLPTIRTSDINWQEGTCTLLVREPLFVRRLQTRDCRQTKYAALPDPNHGESFELQLFSESAVVQLDLSRQSAPAQLSTGLSVELGDRTAQAELLAAWQMPSGRRSSVTADILGRWNIDAIETIPVDALESWRVGTAEARPQLTVRLARPMSSENPIKLVIRAHCRAAADQQRQWRANDLDLLRFHDITSDEKLLQLRPSAGHVVEISDAVDLTRVEEDQLTASQLALFPSGSRAFVYRVDPERTTFTATLQERQPQHDDEIRCDALVGRTGLTESYTMTCQPRGDRVANLLVAFSEPRTEPVHFRIAGEGDGEVAGRRLTSAEQAARKFRAADETWELTLARPRATAFEIAAERTTPHASKTSLSLASLPEATSQSGQLVVRAAADFAMSIRDTSVTPIDVPQDGENATARAAFRYDPSDAAASIVVRRGGAVLTQSSAAIAWHRRVDSRFDAAGHALHVATFSIQNAGQCDLTLTIPDTAEITRLWLDGQLQTPGSGHRTLIAISPDRPSSTIVVEYRSFGPKFDSGRLLSEFAEIDIPLLASDWLLWLPPGYTLANLTGGSAEPAAAGLTWSERWFGPLGLGSGDSRFDILSSDSWKSLLEWPSRPSEGAAAAFATRFGDIARLLDNDSREPTWGALLTKADDAARDLGIVLLVDAPALAAMQIGPHSDLRTNAVESTIDQRSNPLGDANLTLLATPKAVLLTSRLNAAIQRDYIRWITPGVLANLVAGPLRAALDTAPDSGVGILHPSDWVALDASPRVMPSPMTPTDDDASGPYLIRCQDTGPVEAFIVRGAAMTLWRLASAVLVLATCLCLALPMRPLVMALPFAAALALVVPTAIVPLATGCLWGVAGAVAWRWIASRPGLASRPTGQTPSISSMRWKSAASAAPLVLIGVTLGFTSVGRGQDAGGIERSGTAPVIHRVFIPVDSEERPTKDKYQVPEQFYDELRRRVGDEPNTGQGWLIRSARYRVTINRESASDTLGPSDILAQYEVVVLKPDALVSLPMTGVRPGLTARREGREFDIPWDSDEDGFTCRFDEPGTYQLNVSLRPPRGEDTQNTLEMAIPPVPQSTVEVQLPSNPPTVEFPTACGATTLSADARKLSADLGPATRLSIRWSRTRQSRLSAAVGDADVSLWLQIQPASVVVHARLDIKALKSPLNELWLSIDPRLRPLPVVDRSGTVASVQPVAGDPQTVRIELARPVADHVTIPVSFLLTGSSGIGQLSLPRILPQGVRVRDRLLAVSVDPTLQHDLQSSAPKIAVAEFLSHWGAAPAAPQWAIRLPEGEPWKIATRPRETHGSLKQRLLLSVAESRALVEFHAQIAAAEGQMPAAPYQLQYRLTAPRELEVEKIALIHDGLDRVNRWSRDAEGMITVFLSSPVSGRMRLTLSGQMPVKLGSWSLPRINVDYPGQRDTTVLVFRQPDTHVALEAAQGLLETERSRANDEESLPGRLALAMTARDDEFAATLRITRNEPRVHATQFTSLTRANNAWEGRVEFRALIADGCLDAVGFNLPPEWTGPFEITPPASLEIIPDPDNNQRLIVRPKTPLEGEQGFTLRSPLRLATGDPISLPVVIRGAGEDITSYLVLPTAIGGEHVAWKTSGLRPDQLPPDMTPSSLPSAYIVYRATEPSAQAWSSLVQPGVPSSGTIASIHAAWSPSAPCRGVATFVISGSTHSPCQLRIPEEMEVLELRVSGLPITPRKTKPGVEIPFTTLHDPQVVEVVYRNKPVVSSLMGRVTFVAPSMIEPEATSTAWHVYGLGAGSDARLVAVNDLAPQIWPTRELGVTSDVPLLLAGGASWSGRWFLSGGVPSIVVQYRPLWSVLTHWRWPTALLLVVAGAVAALSLRRSGQAPITIGWPTLATGALGLGLAAWGNPVWLGVLLVTCSILAACWPLVARKTVPADHSAVVPGA